MANSDVKLKHKVQLRKKVEEPNMTVGNESGHTDNTPTPTPQKSKKWIRIILGIIVVCVIAYLLFPKSGDKTAATPEQDIETIESEEFTDSLTNTDEAEDVVSSNNQGETVNEADNQEVKGSEAPAPQVGTPTTASNTSSTTNSATNISNDVEAEAMKVIRGDYGVGQERKNKLGTKYQTIQSRVNELKREGIF